MMMQQVMMMHQVLIMIMNASDEENDGDDDNDCNHEYDGNDDCTGKLIIGKLSEFIGGCPINSDNFIGSDKIIGWLFSV